MNIINETKTLIISSSIIICYSLISDKSLFFTFAILIFLFGILSDDILKKNNKNKRGHLSINRDKNVYTSLVISMLSIGLTMTVFFNSIIPFCLIAIGCETFMFFEFYNYKKERKNNDFSN